MLIKIKDDWVDPAEIAAAAYAPASKVDPERFLVELRGGGSICLYCSPRELEEALVAAGLAGGSSKAAAGIPEKDLPALTQLYNEGYRFLARDVDGHVYAYRSRPTTDGVFWDPASLRDDEVKALAPAAFAFVTAEDREPFDIGTILPH